MKLGVYSKSFPFPCREGARPTVAVLVIALAGGGEYRWYAVPTDAAQRSSSSSSSALVGEEAPPSAKAVIMNGAKIRLVYFMATYASLQSYRVARSVTVMILCRLLVEPFSFSHAFPF